MAMNSPPWDQRVARHLARPLAKTPVTPNQVTVATALIAFAGAGLLAMGEAASANWGAGLFVLARFLDHVDGELARLKGQASRLGYYLDYLAGAGSYMALFLALGYGLRGGPLGDISLAIGTAGALAAVVGMVGNLAIDRQTGGAETGDAIGYPGFAGFELEDGIYLLAPITWLGFLYPFFVAAGIGAAIYGLWTIARWALGRRQ